MRVALCGVSEMNGKVDFSKGELSGKMEELKKRMDYIERRVVEKDIHDDSEFHHELFNVRKLYLETEIYLNKALLSGRINKSDIEKETNQLDIYNKNLTYIDQYYNNILKNKQKQSVDSLTLITLIFLPLTLITGYFGMNFKSMGSPSARVGIFAKAKAHSFVFSLFVVSVIIILILVKTGVIYN